MLLLEKIVETLDPPPELLNIAYQLSSLLISLLALNKIDLPSSLRQNNETLIALLTKVSEIEVFHTKIANEPQRNNTGNALSKMMRKHPVAALFSISVFDEANDYTKNVFYCVSALIFWSYFHKIPQLVLDEITIKTRLFIEEYCDIEIKKNFIIEIDKNIASLSIDLLLRVWLSLLLQKSEAAKCHQSLFGYAVRLADVQPISIIDDFKPLSKHYQTDKLHPPLTLHTSNITPIKNISPDVKATIQKRRYIPLLKHKENIAEDNSIELADISVESSHYIDEQALDQSYLYGSRLALQELMQLSLRPVALLDYEILMITERIKQALCSDDIDEIKSAVLALLLLCTSKGYEYLENISINRNEIPNTNTDCICLKTKTWNRFDIRMPDSFTATEEQKKHLKQVDHLLRLPLPLVLISALEKLINRQGVDCIAVKDLFKDDLDNFLITARITKLLKKGVNQCKNISPASIRNLLFEKISKKETPAIASLLLANTEYASNTSLYYLFQSHRNMVFLYQNSLKELGFESNTMEVNAELYCGSELAILLWPSKDIVSVKYNEIITDYKVIDEQSSISSLIRIHNQITLYSTLILLITTGHRPRIEYSFSDFTIDEEKELIYITDKQNFCDSALRILPLADVVLENLKTYRIHCDRLSRLTQKYCPLLTQKLLRSSQNLRDTNQPLLYLINQDLTTRPVGYSEIERYLDMWDLPTNAFRHYFCSFLQGTSASGIVGNFMGHIRSGEHIYSNDSLFCHDDLLINKRAINALAESLNCQSLMLVPKAGRKIPLISYDKDTVYTPRYLLPGQAFNKSKLRHSVRKLINEVYKDNSQFFKDIKATKESLLTSILEDENLSTREFNYKLKMLDKFMTKIVGTKKLPAISKTYADNENTTLGLHTDSLFKAKQADRVKEELQTWILSKTQNKTMTRNTANREFVKIILSLVVHASFSFTIDVEFIRALKSPVFKDGSILWLAWTDSKNKKQRIFIDAITAQLIINNPVYLKTKLNHPSEISKKLFQYLSKKIKILPIQQKLVENKRIDINKLIRFLNNRFFFTHTGLSQSYLNQKQETTHLSNEILTRWLRNSPCYKIETEGSENDSFTAQSLIPPNKKINDDKSISLGIEILSDIRDKLNQQFSRSGYTSSEMLISIVQGSWASKIDLIPKKDLNLQQMIDQSHLLTESTIATLCWLYHTAGKPGKGRKTIAIKTLLSYISKVAKPLIITADIQPFFTLSKSELQNLYIKVIESRKVKNKNEAAEVLRTFHNYIYDSFKVPKVSWLEIEPSIYSKTNNVRANIISYREYEEILLFLENDDSLTTDEILINQTIFTLCYRTGLRKSEAENLMVDEVDFDNGIIHIKTNRYDRVKTLKSNRRIPMHLFLSPDEINRLKQLVQRTLQFNDQKRNIGIFSKPLDHTKLIDFTTHTNAIVQAMKTVTYDPSMSLHICRHSFANYLYLLVSRGEFPPSIKNELKLWSRTQDNYQQFTQKLINVLINEQFSPHKILHAISLLLGHLEVTTTIKNYVHVLDIISAAENEKRLNQSLEIKHLKWVNNLPIHHANKIVSRFDTQQRRHIAISYYQLKQFKHFSEVDVVRINDITPLKNNPQTAKKKISLVYNMAMFEVVLRALEEKISIEEIVKKVTFSEAEIEKIIKISEQLKNKIAYDGVIIHSSDSNIEFYNDYAKSKKTKAYINTPSYKTILDKLNKLENKDRTSLLGIWLDNYDRKISGYTFKNRVDADIFKKIINKLEYKLVEKEDDFILIDDAKKMYTSLFDIINPARGEAKKSINLKFDHALFLIAIHESFS